MSKSNKHCFVQDKRGSVGMLFALTTITITGVVGMAVDVGRALSTKGRLQGALDASVLAASNEPADRKLQVAQAYFTANFMDRFGSGTAIPQFTTNPDGSVGGEVTAFVDTTFAKMFGVENLQIAVSSSVKPTVTTTETTTTTTTETIPGATPCIHIQDQNGTSFRLENNENVNFSRCEVHARSNNSQAMVATGNTNVKFKRILLKGGASTSGGVTVVDSPYVIKTDQNIGGSPYDDAVRDIAHLVSVGSCNNSNTDKKYENVTVYPGTYCGTTEFKGVTFAQGLYVIAQASGNKAGELILTGRVDGSAGVSFYFSGNKSGIKQYGLEDNSVLKAPTSGISKGLLFFEASNRGQIYDAIFNTCKQHSWTGIIYLPSANVTLQGFEDWPTLNIGMVVNQLKMKNMENIINPYEWTPYGFTSPILLPSELRTVTATATTPVDKSKFLLK